MTFEGRVGGGAGDDVGRRVAAEVPGIIGGGPLPVAVPAGVPGVEGLEGGRRAVEATVTGVGVASGAQVT